jgi:hypothetical protein
MTLRRRIDDTGFAIRRGFGAGEKRGYQQFGKIEVTLKELSSKFQ